MPQFCQLRKKNTSTQNCPACSSMAKTSASSTDCVLMPCTPWIADERREPVAAARGALELELLGRLLHLLRDAGFHRVGLARQKGARLARRVPHILRAEISCVQGPEQRLIWKSRQGRVRFS